MDLESQKAAERLREIERALARPPTLFVQVASEVAGRLGVDADRLIAGEGLLWRGMVFYLAHYGQVDAQGLTVFVQIGALPQEDRLAFLVQLLEHNVESPELAGTYGVMPGADTVVLRNRIDLGRGEGACDEILRHIEACASRFESVAALTHAVLDIAKMMPREVAP